MKNLSLLVFTLLLTLNLYSQTQYNATTYHQFNTNYGYLQIGAQSTTTALFSTDRPSITFNKPIFTTGGIISSTGTDNMYLQTGGNTRLTINSNNGDIFITGRLLMPYDKRLIIGYDNNVNSRLELSSSNSINHAFIDFKENLYFRALEGMSCPLALQNDGNVAIGFAPNYVPGDRHTQGNRLAVNGNTIIVGTLTALKIYVKTNVWSDYVFDPDYKLKSLEEIETFINENKHLPDVPSAKEVIEGGIDVADMNAILLRKVEELTLLMIEQNKTIQELQSRLDKLQK